MRLDRLLSIVITLLNKDKITANELSKKYEVSVRTIYRDLDALHQAGIPVVAYAGNAGGYGIMENYRLERQLLTLSDMAVILAALKGIQTSLPSAEMEKAVEKIGSLVPRDKRNVIAEFNERIAVDMTGWCFDEKRKLILGKLYDAVVSNRLVRFVYRNLKGEQKQRTVEPMTLLFKGSSWYLLGYCRGKADFRIFHIGRMKGVEVQLATFQRRPFAHIDFFKGETAGGFAAGTEPKKYINLVLRFPANLRMKVEEFYSTEQIRENDGFLYASSRVPEDEWVYGMILSYGGMCEVVQPESVRSKIKAMIKKMTAIYHGSEASSRHGSNPAM
jgi:predicted DNA-binding transcriptional regulator YafY